MDDWPGSGPPVMGLDLDHANIARVYDYFLGGTSNWAIDRALGDELLAAVPIIGTIARVNREFLDRAVRYCVRRGITQFLDLGSGIPTVGNVHEVADRLDPDTRCVYVDCEPVAVAHAKVLLENQGNAERHAVLHADLRHTKSVWAQALATGVLDPSKPVGLLMVSVLHFLDPQEEVPAVVREYRNLLPSGSHLIMSHATMAGVPDELRRQFDVGAEMYKASGNPVFPRPPEVIRSYFGDFALLDPGLVWVAEWHRDAGEHRESALIAANPSRGLCLGGIGVKP